MNRELFTVGQDLRGRLQYLVTVRHDGRVARAAEAWHVPQPTLHRFLAGTTETVNSELVRCAATHERVSTDWLLQGTGIPPEAFPQPYVTNGRWTRLVKSLNLPPDAERAVSLLPNQISHAARYLCWHGSAMLRTPDVSYQVAMPAARGATEGATLEVEAWSALLEGLIDAYGTEAVAEKLTAEVDLVRLGFKPFSSHLYWTNHIQDLRAVFAEHAPTGDPATMTHPPSMPPGPALEVPRIRQGRGKAVTTGTAPLGKRGRQ